MARPSVEGSDAPHQADTVLKNCEEGQKGGEEHVYNIYFCVNLGIESPVIPATSRLICCFNPRTPEFGRRTGTAGPSSTGQQ
jgi:hypothetical protein